MMVAVFEHNLHDLLSLVGLTCRIGRLLDAATDPPPSVYELFGAARVYEDLGLLEEAYARYEQALAAHRDAAIRARVASRLAALCKRVGRHERAIQLWRRLASLGLTGCEPFVELAKHFEHRVRDYDAAIRVVGEALAVCELHQFRNRPEAAAERADLEHRLARLLAKRRRLSSIGEVAE
jgi:tetratricopeptide (TPR) repeat protein